jgi:hypothetical protein
MHDLDHPASCWCKNTDNWRTRKDDLHHAFPLDVPMVTSTKLTVVVDGERLSCDIFSLRETNHFGSLDFISDRFGGLSLSPMGDGSDVAVMDTTRGGPPSPPRAKTGYSTEESHMASDRGGRVDLPSPRRHDTGPQPSPP